VTSAGASTIPTWLRAWLPPGRAVPVEEVGAAARGVAVTRAKDPGQAVWAAATGVPDIVRLPGRRLALLRPLLHGRWLSCPPGPPLASALAVRLLQRATGGSGLLLRDGGALTVGSAGELEAAAADLPDLGPGDVLALRLGDTGVEVAGVHVDAALDAEGVRLRLAVEAVLAASGTGAASAELLAAALVAAPSALVRPTPPLEWLLPAALPAATALPADLLARVAELAGARGCSPTALVEELLTTAELQHRPWWAELPATPAPRAAPAW